MAVWYVNAVNGTTGGVGTSWATARNTLANVDSLASAGDTIYASGVFKGTIPTSKAYTWIGYGYCEFNGNNGAGAVISVSNFRNITFTNFSSACSFSSNAVAYQCIFRDMANGLAGATATGSCVECIFYNCSTSGLSVSVSGGTTFFVNNCIFYNNGIDISSTVGICTLNYNVFGSAVQLGVISAANIGAGSDYNVYDFTNGHSTFNGTTVSSLATWKTDIVAPKEANSIDRSSWRTDVEDYANFLLHSNPSGFLLTAGPSAFPQLGPKKPAFGISQNVNSSLWSAGVFTNTQLDGSNFLVLSAGQSTGTWASGVADLTTNTSLYRINTIIANENYPTTYMDTGTLTGFLSIEIRGSTSAFLDTDGTIPWIVMPRNAEVGQFVATNNFRYWQVRLTLHG